MTAVTVLCPRCGRPAGAADAVLLSDHLARVDPDPRHLTDIHRCEGI